MPVGETTLLLVGLVTEQPGAELLETLLCCAEAGEAQLHDFVIISRRTARTGSLREVAFDEFALAGIALRSPGLIGLDDAVLFSTCVTVGTSAAIILVETVSDASAPTIAALRRHDVIAVRSVPAIVTNTLLESARPHLVTVNRRRGCARAFRPRRRPAPR